MFFFATANAAALFAAEVLTLSIACRSARFRASPAAAITMFAVAIKFTNSKKRKTTIRTQHSAGFFVVGPVSDFLCKGGTLVLLDASCRYVSVPFSIVAHFWIPPFDNFVIKYFSLEVPHAP